MNITDKQVVHFSFWLREKYDFTIWPMSRLTRKIKFSCWLKKIPLKRIDGITLGNRVYVGNWDTLTVYRKLGLTLHEFKHVRQGRNMGWDKFYSQYISDRDKRIDLEIEAYVQNIYVHHMLYAGTGIVLDLNKLAEQLVFLYGAEPKHVRQAITIYNATWNALETGLENPALVLWNECYK